MVAEVGEGSSFVRDLLAGGPILRVQARTDALPGGLALAMLPVLVDWKASSVGGGSDDHYQLHFVNAGGNPVEGTTHLVSAHVPCDGLRGAEFVVVNSRRFGLDRVGAHAQLRLLFDPGRRPTLIGNNGRRLSRDAEIDDLVFSWEAWRPPATDFHSRQGLDPNNYALSMRCFTGPQRFLEDSLRNRNWICYPLALPAAEDAGGELLYAILLIGDSLARLTLARILEHLAEPSALARGEPGNDLQSWAQLKALVADAPDSPLEAVLGSGFSYQTLTRSCVTMALTCIDVAMARLWRRAGLGEWKPLQVSTEDPPAWVKELSHASIRGFFERLPSVIWWLMKNHTVIPKHAHEVLERAGLLQRQNGHVVQHEYDIGGATPYGSVQLQD